MHKGACVECNTTNFDTGVKTCVSAANTTDPATVTCDDEYVYDTKTTSPTHKCVACTSNCLKCTISGEDKICGTPKTGYAVDSNTKLLVECSKAAGCDSCTLSGSAGS